MFDYYLQTLNFPQDAEFIRQGIADRLLSLRRNVPPPPLFHYTDAHGLKGIIESGVLRATHVSFMNDASEYVHAVRLFGNAIGRLRNSVDSMLAQLLSEMEPDVTLTEAQHAGPYFVACFSSKENNLNQWRAYSRGEGGYSIGFDADAIDRSAAAVRAYLVPAIYCPNRQLSFVSELLEWGLAEYSRRAQNCPAKKRDHHRREWLIVFLSCCQLLAPIFKNPDFSEEDEWRLIHWAASTEGMQFSARPTGLAPFVNLALRDPNSPQSARLPIRTLWSGPGRNSEISLLAARALLEKHGYNGVALHSSKIPFRVG